jgi:predicted membrane protein
MIRNTIKLFLLSLVYLIFAVLYGFTAALVIISFMAYSFWEFCQDEKRLKKQKEKDDLREAEIIKIENDRYDRQCRLERRRRKKEQKEYEYLIR